MKIRELGEFEKNAFIIFFLTGIAGGLAYLYQILLGHLLSVEEYGLINTLLTAISLATTVLFPLCYIASRNIVILKTEKRYDELDEFISAILISSTVICVGLFSITLILQIWGNGVLESDVSWVNFGVILVSNVFYNVFIYILQGHKNFVLYGIVSNILSLVKCITVVFIMKLGGGINDAMFSILLANIVCIVIMLLPTAQYSIIKKYKWKKAKKWYIEIISLYGWFFFQQMFISFFTNGGDIILVKTYFSDKDSGYYSVAILLCKLILFAVTPIITAMFPEIAQNSSNRKKTYKLLSKTIVYGMALILVYFVVLAFAGGKIIEILYGREYALAADMLYPAMIYVIAIIFVHIFSQYYIALGKIKAITIVMGLTIVPLFCVGKIVDTIAQYVVAIGLLIMIIPIYAIVDNVVINRKKSE